MVAWGPLEDEPDIGSGRKVVPDYVKERGARDPALGPTPSTEYPANGSFSRLAEAPKGAKADVPRNTQFVACTVPGPTVGSSARKEIMVKPHG